MPYLFYIKNIYHNNISIIYKYIISILYIIYTKSPTTIANITLIIQFISHSFIHNYIHFNTKNFKSVFNNVNKNLKINENNHKINKENINIKKEEKEIKNDNECFKGFINNDRNDKNIISKECFNKCFIEEFNMDKEIIKNNKNENDFMSVCNSDIIWFTIVCIG